MAMKGSLFGKLKRLRNFDGGATRFGNRFITDGERTMPVDQWAQEAVDNRYSKNTQQALNDIDVLLKNGELKEVGYSEDGIKAWSDKLKEEYEEYVRDNAPYQYYRPLMSFNEFKSRAMNYSADDEMAEMLRNREGILDVD